MVPISVFKIAVCLMTTGLEPACPFPLPTTRVYNFFYNQKNKNTIRLECFSSRFQKGVYGLFGLATRMEEVAPQSKKPYFEKKRCLIKLFEEKRKKKQLLKGNRKEIYMLIEISRKFESLLRSRSIKLNFYLSRQVS